MLEGRGCCKSYGRQTSGTLILTVSTYPKQMAMEWGNSNIFLSLRLYTFCWCRILRYPVEEALDAGIAIPFISGLS